MAKYEELPVSETEAQPEPQSQTRFRSTVSTSCYMVAWIVTSNATILFNKWLIGTAGFKFPILLTCWHLIFSAIITQVLARTTSLLDSRHSLPINTRFYLRTILPIGIVSSGSIVCANFVYLYLSVAFIQMLKASSPVVVLFVSWLWGIANPTMGNIVTILFIVMGVAMAGVGEISLSWIGVAFQLCGLTFEAIRVVMIQVMLQSEGMSMDPLVGLYYYSPVCAAINFVVACVIETPHFSWNDVARVGPWVLVLNAAFAFLTSFTSMVLIGKTSGLVTTLTGIFKNILLIVFSVIIWNTEITTLQVVGYTVSLLALIYYAFGLEKLLLAWKACMAWVAGIFTAPEKARISSKARIGLVISTLAILSVCILVGYQKNIATDFKLSFW